MQRLGQVLHAPAGQPDVDSDHDRPGVGQAVDGPAQVGPQVEPLSPGGQLATALLVDLDDDDSRIRIQRAATAEPGVDCPALERGKATSEHQQRTDQGEHGRSRQPHQAPQPHGQRRAVVEV